MSAGAAKRGKKMGDLPQWVCWRAELREGKATKIPYSPHSGSRARSDDPATWGTLSEARKAVREGDYNGIGFVFTESDPFCGVDLDACVDPKTGEIASWASEIVEALESYTEFSPSGTGLHVLLRAELPPGGNRRARIEMYDRGRFFTVTGRRLRGTSHVVEERQEQLSALHDRLFSPRKRDVPERQGKVASDKGLDDAEVLRRPRPPPTVPGSPPSGGLPPRIHLRLRAGSGPLLHARVLGWPRRDQDLLALLPLGPDRRGVQPRGLPQAHDRPRPLPDRHRSASRTFSPSRSGYARRISP